MVAAAASYRPVPPLEAFAEALAVPPWLHVPPGRPVRVLTVGAYAEPAAKLALRYPDTAEVVLAALGGMPLPTDRRARAITGPEDLPASWKADLIAVALPGDPAPVLPLLARHLAPDGVLVVGVDQFSRGRAVREAMSRLWPQVIAYREHAPEPVLFLMASSRRFGRPLRPLPTGLRRLTEPYLRGLFLLAKDEHTHLFGPKDAA